MNNIITAWFILVIFFSSYLSNAYKILVVFPLPGKSHGILSEGVCRHLLGAGHEVTLITPFIPKKPEKNLRIIDISELTIFLEEQKDVLNITALLEKKVTMDDAKFLRVMMHMLNKLMLNNTNVQNLLSDPKEQFDLVILEWLFSEVSCGIPAVLSTPYVWLSTIDPHWMVMGLIDENLNPAYNADGMSNNALPFTFKQRLQELWTQISVTVFKEYIFTQERTDYQEIFSPLAAKRGTNLGSFDYVKYNASLMLGNSHVSMGQATRLPQNYIPVGGYHIDSKVKPLPEDLQKIMDKAKKGVIYFSMGSNLKSKDLPDELKKRLLKMFGGLHQTVIWKFEEVLPNLPSNVHILQWAPQHSILSHPNCVLFITHGGLLSTTETIHFGVPIIGIPVFGDQFVNVNRAVNRGFGKRVDLSYAMVEEMNTAINDILNDHSYREKVEELSVIYHDRPVLPGVELVHWVQHVVRTRGAPHLRSPALDMPLYQKLYLDLICLILAVICLVKFTIKRIFFSRKKVNTHKKTN